MKGHILGLLASLALLSACGGGSSGNSGANGVIDLAKGDTALTITFAPGEVRPGAPQLIATGDFNGDGKKDLLLGAPFSNGPGGSRPGAGEAFVFYGPLSGDIDLQQRQPDVRILGASTNDNLGFGVAAGDLNGDGIDDIVVGAPNSNGIPEVRTNMGEGYVVLGGRHIASTVDILAKQEDFLLQPAEGFSQLGRTFAIADVNGDGIGDLIAGAPYAGREANTPPGGKRTTVGEVYVVYGKRDLHGSALVARDAEDVRLAGVAMGDQFGNSVAAADVNGDGIADVIVGAPGYDGPAADRQEAGGAFVFFGGSLPKTGTLGDASITITGADGFDNFGTLVAALDVNGDGKAEVVGSAPSGSGPDDKRSAAGELAVVDATRATGGSLDLKTDAGQTFIYSANTAALAPASIAALTSKGKGRVAFGSVLGSSATKSGGQAIVVTPALGQPIDLAAANAGALTVTSAGSNDGLGASVAFADVDGDGTPELLVLAAGPPTPATPDPNYRARLYAVRLN